MGKHIRLVLSPTEASAQVRSALSRFAIFTAMSGGKSIERTKLRSPELLSKLILEGDRSALSRGITLIESDRVDDYAPAGELLETLLPHSGNALRVGITGVPGVGKSTFIESLGMHLISRGKQVAVLAIDPTSQSSGGSILGDKTRMERLSQEDKAYIRPTPAGRSLGGVAAKTREAMLLCEAAGYEIILVETVGVGQSETMAHSMVDFFVLLMLAGAGDELQGIKRGIMEMADLVLINKADGDNVKKAKKARADYLSAFHLFPPKPGDWQTRVQICSSLEETGIDETWDSMQEFEKIAKTSGTLDLRRKDQSGDWFDTAVQAGSFESFLRKPGKAAELDDLRNQVLAGELSALQAARLALGSHT